MDTRALESMHVATRTSASRAWWRGAWAVSAGDASWRRSSLDRVTLDDLDDLDALGGLR